MRNRATAADYHLPILFHTYPTITIHSTDTDGTRKDDGPMMLQIDPQPPDGGCGSWSCLIIFASFINFLIIEGMAFSFPTIIVIVGSTDLTAQQDFPGGTTAACQVLIATYMILGVVAAPMVNTYGCRRVVVSGGILASIGLLSGTVTKNPIVIYVGFGILTALGMSMINLGSFVALSMYYSRNRRCAVAIAQMGSNIGMAFMPLVVSLVVDSHRPRMGQEQLLTILACVMMQTVVCGMLMKPVKPKYFSSHDRYPLPPTKHTLDRLTEHGTRFLVCLGLPRSESHDSVDHDAYDTTITEREYRIGRLHKKGSKMMALHPTGRNTRGRLSTGTRRGEHCSEPQLPTSISNDDNNNTSGFTETTVLEIDDSISHQTPSSELSVGEYNSSSRQVAAERAAAALLPRPVPSPQPLVLDRQSGRVTHVPVPCGAIGGSVMIPDTRTPTSSWSQVNSLSSRFGSTQNSLFDGERCESGSFVETEQLDGCFDHFVALMELRLLKRPSFLALLAGNTFIMGGVFLLWTLLPMKVITDVTYVANGTCSTTNLLNNTDRILWPVISIGGAMLLGRGALSIILETPRCSPGGTNAITCFILFVATLLYAFLPVTVVGQTAMLVITILYSCIFGFCYAIFFGLSPCVFTQIFPVEDLTAAYGWMCVAKGIGPLLSAGTYVLTLRMNTRDLYCLIPPNVWQNSMIMAVIYMAVGLIFFLCLSPWRVRAQAGKAIKVDSS